MSGFIMLVIFPEAYFIFVYACVIYMRVHVFCMCVSASVQAHMWSGTHPHVCARNKQVDLGVFLGRSALSLLI